MRAHSSEGLDGRGLSCACFDQRLRRRIPQGLIKLYDLALVEGLSTLEQHGLKSGDDQVVQRLTIVRDKSGSWPELFHCSMAAVTAARNSSSVGLVIGRPQCDRLQLGAL